MKCDFCDSFCVVGAEMNNHVGSMHSEELEKIRQRRWVMKAKDAESGVVTDLLQYCRRLMKCLFCDCFHRKGSGIENHVLSNHPEALNRYIIL